MATPNRKQGKQPNSPANIENAASKIAEILLDMSADEADRTMLAVYAVCGDVRACVFHTERIEQRDDAEADEIGAGLISFALSTDGAESEPAPARGPSPERMAELKRLARREVHRG